MKKTVNLYLLLRATITDNELDAYLGDGRGGPYQAAALLLAATVGCPAEAADLLRCVLAADPAGSVRSVLAEPGDDVPGVALRRRLRAWVETLVDDHPATDDVRCYQAYARAVARYSFESYALFDAPAGRPAEQERTDSQR